MEYGKRLKQLREAKEFSIYRLSKDSDISQGHISDLENGKNQPTIETLNKLPLLWELRSPSSLTKTGRLLF